MKVITAVKHIQII